MNQENMIMWMNHLGIGSGLRLSSSSGVEFQQNPIRRRLPAATIRGHGPAVGRLLANVSTAPGSRRSRSWAAET